MDGGRPCSSRCGSPPPDRSWWAPRTLFLRDVFSNHFPNKAFGAEELRHGRVPAFNPTLGLGQPFRGNPARAPLYPGNLLYLVLPLFVAFNAHYALHWLLAGVSMALLARALGMGRWAMLVAAITYAGGGWVLSNLSFYNLIAFAAWWPLAMAGAARGGRGGVALGGLAAGLAFLAGEPMTWALGVVPLALVAVERHGWKRGGLVAGAIAALGLIVALPQVVATARVLPFSLRGWRGVSVEEAGQYALHPARLLELVLPLPFGWPGWVGPHGWWARAVYPKAPYFFSLYHGVVALWLAARERGRRAWVGLAVLGLAAAWAGGPLASELTALSGGSFRFPEKFVVWVGLTLPLLAGWGVERLARESNASAGKSARWFALACGLACAAVLAARPSIVRAVERATPPPLRADAVAIASTQGREWSIGFGVAAALLAASSVAGRRRMPGALAALQLLGLVQLWPLVATDETAPYRARPAWIDDLEDVRAAAAAQGAVRVAVASAATGGTANTMPAGMPPGPQVAYDRLQSANLDPTPGVLHGLSYPLYPDSEGLGSSLHSFWQVNLLDSNRRSDLVLAWLRVVGVRALVLFDDPASFGLPVLAVAERWSGRTWLAAVPGPAPPAFWPDSVAVAATPIEALRAVGALAEPTSTAILSEAVARHGRGTARLLEEHADRLVVETEGEGGIVVVQRGYHPLYIRPGGRRAIAHAAGRPGASRRRGATRTAADRDRCLGAPGGDRGLRRDRRGDRRRRCRTGEDGAGAAPGAARREPFVGRPRCFLLPSPAPDRAPDGAARHRAPHALPARRAEHPLPMKAAQARAMRAGELPVGRRAAGRAARRWWAIPNASALYPDNLLFLVGPLHWAHNARFWIHWLIAPLAMFVLARAWGLGGAGRRWPARPSRSPAISSRSSTSTTPSPASRSRRCFVALLLRAATRHEAPRGPACGRRRRRAGRSCSSRASRSSR